jgi:hypothetical protein
MFLQYPFSWERDIEDGEVAGACTRGWRRKAPCLAGKRYWTVESAVVVDDVRVGGERKRSGESQSGGGVEGVG